MIFPIKCCNIKWIFRYPKEKNHKQGSCKDNLKTMSNGEGGQVIGEEKKTKRLEHIE